MESDNKKALKIGIMGLGMVGGALKNYLEERGFRLFFYDKEKNQGSVEEVNKGEIIFICVPTPFDKENGFDLSFVKEACENVKGEKIVVLKSTVLPGTTQKLQEEYPSHKFLFNPEFLTEAMADHDMKFPQRQILGFTEKSRDIAKDIMKILPRSPFEKIMGSSEAEMVKYFSNTWYSTKVIFANQIYDLCQKTGIDYESVKEAASADKMIGPSHLEIFHKGYRGYGGKCLSKEIKSFIRFADENEINLKLHKMVEEINKDLLNDKNN